MDEKMKGQDPWQDQGHPHLSGEQGRSAELTPPHQGRTRRENPV